MKGWLFIAVVAAGFYVVGAKYPSLAGKFGLA